MLDINKDLPYSSLLHLIYLCYNYSNGQVLSLVLLKYLDLVHLFPERENQSSSTGIDSLSVLELWRRMICLLNFSQIQFHLHFWVYLGFQQNVSVKTCIGSAPSKWQLPVKMTVLELLSSPTALQSRGRNHFTSL